MSTHSNIDVWQTLSNASSFCRRVLNLWPTAVEQLLDDNRLHTCGVEPGLFSHLSDPSDFDKQLRQYRQTECLRIAWRDVNQVAGLVETLQDLSTLAEYCLQACVDFHWQILKQTFGEPASDNNNPGRFCILGMGKLGGSELNFSSDIDLLFVYTGNGKTAGPRRIEVGDFFTRLARATIHSLDTITAQGQVYRVDTRLRPYGATGKLVWSCSAMEQYYALEGRDWERYALLKARPVAGDLALGTSLLKELQPFMYRRYLDYGLFDGVRQLRLEIARAAAKQRHHDNLKIGPGGIREIEFLVQSLQLLRGGQQPVLREPNLLKALALLDQHEMLESKIAEPLGDAYQLLRRLENGLQMIDDQQTHVLPDKPEHCHHLVQLTGFDDFSELQLALKKARDCVADHFDHWFGDDTDQSDTTSLDLSQPLSVSQLHHLLGDTIDERLPSINASLARINKQSLPAGARSRLETLIPDVLKSAIKTPWVERALQHGLALLEGVDLALLQEHPQALARMLDYGARSDYIATKLQRQPALLDELIDPVTLQDLPDSLNDYRQRLLPILAQYDEDSEQQLYRLQHWRQSYALRIAANELLGKIDTPAAQQQLSWLAEVVINAALQQTQALIKQDVPLMVLAYGTLGANEMHYQSDLDLVFLYSDKTTGQEILATRKAQKLIHLLTSIGPGERLYEIDTRLRPNGKSGTLVSSLDTFSEYQNNQAWVWEWQALCRARCLHTNSDDEPSFKQLRQSLLATARPETKLRKAIADMYQRINQQQTLNLQQQRRIKIQFITQFWLLNFQLSSDTVPQNLLEQLSYLEKLKPDLQQQYQQLANDWQLLLNYRHRQQLDHNPAKLNQRAFIVDDLWQQYFID